MITEKDLQAAIDECKGQRNPNASTCIKLAAFYTIREHLFPTEEPMYSYKAGGGIDLDSDSEFARLVNGRQPEDVMPVMDEAMDALKVLNPAFYASVIRKLNN